MKKIFETPTYKRMITILGSLFTVWIIFAAGIFVGYHKANFSREWDDMFSKGMMDSDSAFAPFMHNPDKVNPHGTMGEIISTHLPMIMVKGPQSAEQIVVISSSTTLRLLHGIASTSDIRSGQFVVVVGEPNSTGGIMATFLRIVPPPNRFVASSSISSGSSTNKY